MEIFIIVLLVFLWGVILKGLYGEYQICSGMDKILIVVLAIATTAGAVGIGIHVMSRQHEQENEHLILKRGEWICLEVTVVRKTELIIINNQVTPVSRDRNQCNLYKRVSQHEK